MPADRGDGFMLDESDRLPWLEPAAPVEDAQSIPARKVALLVLLFLLLLAVIIAGGWLYQSRHNAAGGEATLIDAPGGPYKIPANEATGKGLNIEGRTFEGAGDEAYATSGGGNAMGRIDASRAPEIPVADMAAAARPAAPAPAKPAAKAATTGAGSVTSARIKDVAGTGPAVRPAPAAPAPASTGPDSGPQVQLGAYNSPALAESAWQRLVERFSELSDSRYRVEPVLSGGKTLHRLRVAVADSSAAAALCGRLRIAGESCWAVR